MGQHLSESAVDSRIARWVAWLGLIGALAAMFLPTRNGYTPEIASILAVGAIALLAGHAWGLLIVAAADVMLIGKVWPLVAFGSTETSLAAAGVALVGALPGLLLLSRTLPRTVDLVIGQPNSRWRPHGVCACGALTAIWLILPVF